MAQQAYTPPRHKSSDVYVSRHSEECEFIFVRNDTIRRPLTLTYTGPFKVFGTFVEMADPSTGTPSDASTDSSEPSPEVQPDTTAPTKKQTKSGRKVTFPRKFKSYIYFSSIWSNIL